MVDGRSLFQIGSRTKYIVKVSQSRILMSGYLFSKMLVC